MASGFGGGAPPKTLLEWFSASNLKPDHASALVDGMAVLGLTTVDEVLNELSAEVEGFTADWAEARRLVRDHIDSFLPADSTEGGDMNPCVRKYILNLAATFFCTQLRRGKLERSLASGIVCVAAACVAALPLLVPPFFRHPPPPPACPTHYFAHTFRADAESSQRDEQTAPRPVEIRKRQRVDVSTDEGTVRGTQQSEQPSHVISVGKMDTPTREYKRCLRQAFDEVVGGPTPTRCAGALAVDWMDAHEDVSSSIIAHFSRERVHVVDVAPTPPHPTPPHTLPPSLPPSPRRA